jgi:ATP-dependent protease ClpP protease subunit
MSQMTDLKNLAMRIERLYVKQTEKNVKYVRKHLLTDNDIFLSAEEAIEHGCFDGLLSSHIGAIYHQDIDIQAEV